MSLSVVCEGIKVIQDFDFEVLIGGFPGFSCLWCLGRSCVAIRGSSLETLWLDWRSQAMSGTCNAQMCTLIHQPLTAVTRVNVTADGRDASHNDVFIFHYMIPILSCLIVSCSAWTPCCVAGMRGVVVPGHALCSWHVPWTCYAIPLVWHASL